MFLPTVQHVVRAGGRAIVMSHLGRPVGDPAKDGEFSLEPIAARLGELMGKSVKFVNDCIGPRVVNAVAALQDGEILLLENLRFHPAETVIDLAKKNPDKKLTAEQESERSNFATALAAHGEIYVNDAFGTCHRKHVSMYDVPKLLPAGSRVLGFLVEKELQFLGQALNHPKRPFVAILGGSKVSDKIAVIQHLLPKVDQLLIGGAMMFTFWAALGRAVGKSRYEQDKIDLAREIIQQAGAKLHLPVDVVVAAELRAGVATRLVQGEIPPDLMGLDVGPRTLEQWQPLLAGAGTILWNGPVGAFETKPFEAGTYAIARLIAHATDGGAISVIGGGDSAAAIEDAGVANRISHISTGGGASLEFLEGKAFGPIEVLDDAGTRG